MSTITGTDASGIIHAIQTDINGNLIVVSVDTYRSKVIIYGDEVLAPNGTITLASYTVPSGKRFYFKGGLVGGDEAGEFSFEITSGRIGLWRNSGASRSALVNFPEMPEASAGAVIEIRVKNIGIKNKQFEATIYGYTLPA